jgi:uncharacterized protein with ParB-like and HNH nuclease domain
MRIEDITPLIYTGSNGVSISLNELQPTLDRLARTYGLDLDPEFQRGHVWTTEIQAKFVTYILRGGVVPPIRFNSPEFGGQPRSMNCDLPQTVVLVDGKQRLTALMAFMGNKLKVCGGYLLSDFERQDVLLRRIDITYLVNKLQTKKELYQWYIELNEGQIAHTKDELDKVRVMFNQS